MPEFFCLAAIKMLSKMCSQINPLKIGFLCYNKTINEQMFVIQTKIEGEENMGIVRKHIRNLHDGTADGERLFDAIVDGEQVTIELKNSKKQLVQVPWEDIVTQVDAAKNSKVGK